NVSVWFYWQLNRRQNLRADWKTVLKVNWISPEEPSIKPNKHTIDLTTENSHFSKHARVEDVEDDDDLYEQDAECSKKYTNVGNKYDSDVEIVNESNYVVCDNGK
ncbi:10750_t:CDS:2, partial [Dentiscutata heterogama]